MVFKPIPQVPAQTSMHTSRDGKREPLRLTREWELWFNQVRDNLRSVTVYDFTVTATAVPASGSVLATVNVGFAIPPDAAVTVNAPSLATSGYIANCWVTATGNLALRIGNTATTAFSPAATDWRVSIIRGV